MKFYIKDLHGLIIAGIWCCVIPSADVLATDAIAQQVTPTTDAKAAYDWVVEVEPGLRRWLLSRRAPDKPWGRFEPVVKDAMRESSIYARTFHIIGMLDELKPEERREWADYIQSFQDPKTGGGNIRDILFGVESLGCGGLKYPVRVVPHYKNRDELVARIEKLPWQTSPYRAGNYLSSRVTLWSFVGVEQGDKECGKYIRWTIEWLEEHQNPQTGLWGNQKVSLGNRVNGVMKTACFFCFNLGWELPRPEKIIDSCLIHLDNKKGYALEGGFNACGDLNVFLVMWQALKQTDHRQEECRRAAIAHLPRLRRFLRSDGGFGMIPCDPNSPEFHKPSTYHGTGLVVLALAYWLPIADDNAMQELGWHEPRWTGPMWDAKRLAEVIGR